MDFEFKTIDHSKLGELVYQHISEALIKGALKPGERLKICDLAREMGTSVTPVRDAILRLVHEGALLLKSPRDIRVPILHQDRYLEIRHDPPEVGRAAAERAAGNATAAISGGWRNSSTTTSEPFRETSLRARQKATRSLPFRTRQHRRDACPARDPENLWLQKGPVIAAAYEGGGAEP